MSHRPNLTPPQVKSLNLICRSVASDRNLRRWFDGLHTLPSNLRMNAIMQITTDMRRNGEDTDLIGAVCALSDKDVYAAAVDAVAELRR